MLPIHKILLPVDFSGRCLRMTVYAKALAATYGAEVTLLHVVNPMYSFPATAISGPAMIPIPDSVIEDREKQLEQFAEEELRGLSVRRLVYDGDPEAQIAGFVSSEDIQLVVMATHGYGVLRRFLIGSVTAKVLHDVACPVLTGVHLDPHHDGSPQFSNILCAVDVDPHNRTTLSWASQFAADAGAQFGIVHAVAHTDRVAQAGEDLKKLQDAASGASASVHIREGEPADTVCSLAESLGADLLVIGRGAREDMGTLTTTAYAIIRQSPCPVVSV
jgi:nucleotide-binding universal stress UspA family protein